MMVTQMTCSDTWDANCNCVGVRMQNCQADFTVSRTLLADRITVNNAVFRRSTTSGGCRTAPEQCHEPRRTPSPRPGSMGSA